MKKVEIIIEIKNGNNWKDAFEELINHIIPNIDCSVFFIRKINYKEEKE